MTWLRSVAPLAVVALILAPGRTDAQSLFSAEGLGMPVESLDARSRPSAVRASAFRGGTSSTATRLRAQG